MKQYLLYDIKHKGKLSELIHRMFIPGGNEFPIINTHNTHHLRAAAEINWFAGSQEQFPRTGRIGSNRRLVRLCHVKRLRWGPLICPAEMLENSG